MIESPAETREDQLTPVPTLRDARSEHNALHLDSALDEFGLFNASVSAAFSRQALLLNLQTWDTLFNEKKARIQAVMRGGLAINDYCHTLRSTPCQNIVFVGSYSTLIKSFPSLCLALQLNIPDDRARCVSIS
jgi:hypothetical protein